MALETTLVPPQGRILTVNVHAPMEPGSYTLLVDLVADGLFWFRRSGAAPLALGCTVLEADGRQGALDDDVDELRRIANDQFHRRSYSNAVDNYRRLLAQEAPLDRSELCAFGQALKALTVLPMPNEITITLEALGWDRPETWQLAADWYRRSGRFDEALSALLEILYRAGESGDVLKQLAEVAAGSGDPHAALHYLRKALAVAPDDDRLQACAAELYLRFGNPVLADRHARRSVALAPATAGHYAIQAEVFLANDDPESALNAAQSAWMIDPGQQEIRLVLDKCLRRMGREEQADRLNR